MAPSRSYTIRIRGIRFRGKLGASRSERDLPQDVLVDVELSLPPELLPNRDRVRDVFDYDGVARLVVEEGTARVHHLLETYARRVVDRILEETPALTVKVEVTKLRAPTTYSVDAVTVELSAARSPT